MESEDGEKGTRDAAIAGAVGRGLGAGTRKLYKSTGLHYFTEDAVSMPVREGGREGGRKEE